MPTDTPMQLGMIGLGRLRSNLVRRLIRDGHRGAAYDRAPDVVKALEAEGARGANSLAELADKLERARPGLGPGGRAERGCLRGGAAGAGDFVAMVHNGIGCGMMRGIAEGLTIIRGAAVGRHMDEVDAETAPLREPWAYQNEIDVSD